MDIWEKEPEAIQGHHVRTYKWKLSEKKRSDGTRERISAVLSVSGEQPSRHVYLAQLCQELEVVDKDQLIERGNIMRPSLLDILHNEPDYSTTKLQHFANESLKQLREETPTDLTLQMFFNVQTGVVQ